MSDQPSDAGARREMERMVWAAAFAGCLYDGRGGYDTASVAWAVETADRVAAAYREHGPTR